MQSREKLHTPPTPPSPISAHKVFSGSVRLRPPVAENLYTPSFLKQPPPPEGGWACVKRGPVCNPRSAALVRNQKAPKFIAEISVQGCHRTTFGEKLKRGSYQGYFSQRCASSYWCSWRGVWGRVQGGGGGWFSYENGGKGEGGGEGGGWGGDRQRNLQVNAHAFVKTIL